MQTLTEISSESNFRDPVAAKMSLAYACKFTVHHEKCAHLSAPLRELEMLKLQFPSCLLPPQEGDRFFGRILLPCVGLGPEAGGLGYWFDFSGLEKYLATNPGATAEWEPIRRYWSSNASQAKTRQAYSAEVARLLPSDAWTSDSGVAFPLYRQAGIVPDFSTLLRLGLDGLEASLASREGDFAHACVGAIALLRRSIDEAAKISPPEIACLLAPIRHHPPATFAEAIQLFWLWVLHSGVWNYGRLDVALGPFLQADLAQGRLSEDEALDLLCSLWRLMHAYSNQYNNRVIIGGLGRPDEAAADRFALLAVEATRRVRLNQPQLTLRFHSAQNPALWEAALTAIGEGCTFPMLYNDEVNVPAVFKAFGISESEAVDYVPYGCGEYVIAGRGIGSPNGVINLLKALEVALHGGIDPKTNQLVIPGLRPLGQISSFEDLWQNYTTVVDAHVAVLAKQQAIENRVSGEECPFLFASMLIADCLERNRPLLSGGARYAGGTLETYGNTNTADSLLAIKELVFDRAEITLHDLVEALDRNFEGALPLRDRCRAVVKYGNDEALADEMARRVHDHICQTTRRQAAVVGLDYYLVVIINNWANTILGLTTGASADGRLDGQPMANGNNPSPGSDIQGPTAFLNSLTRLDPSIHAGAVQNMKFSREWFGPMRGKFDALLRAYFAGGGTQAMITVVSRDDLEAAMREPEKWGHLMVRVGGFSIRFVDLPHEAQLEVLSRTLH